VCPPSFPLHVAGRACLSQLTGYGGGDNKDDSKLARDASFSLRRRTPIFPWFYAGFELVLTRKMSFYVVTYYLPSGLFVIVSWIREQQIIDQLKNKSEKLRSCPWTKYI
jgi:hypothetical protein